MPKLEGNIGITTFVVKEPLSIETTKESLNVRTIPEEMTVYGAIEQYREIIDPMRPIPKEVMSYEIQVHDLIVPTVKLPVEQQLIDQRPYKQGRYVKTILDHQGTVTLPNGLQR